MEGIAIGMLETALLQVSEIILANQLQEWKCESFDSLLEIVGNDFNKLRDAVKGHDVDVQVPTQGRLHTQESKAS